MRLLGSAQLGDPALLSRDGAAVRFVRDCIAPLGAEAISNVETRMKILDTGRHLFPVSVNDGVERPDNSYVVSPLTTYARYADFELTQLGYPWLVWPLRGLIAQLGKMLDKGDVNRIVQVNNWLLSTNLYPEDWDGADLGRITGLIVQTYPEHAVGFRSINRFSNPVLFDRLTRLGYLPVPSRQVYLFDARAGRKADLWRRHNNRLDTALLRRTPYRHVPCHELEVGEYSRLAQLYNFLYLDKYCPLNPQFSAQWLRRGQADGWLQLSALRTPAGNIDAVLGWFSKDGILTAPVVGYDTALPQSAGLYRQIMQHCLREAMKRRCILNFSSGAAHFKRLRGGEPHIEYSFVYVDHLPRARQRVWRRLSALLQMFGVPLLRKLKL